MKTQARAVVIGGGIAGCSALYHLTQEGWTDIVLIERDELTSGTTWHSAAQVTNFGAVQTMVGLKTHSIQLYSELANDPDYPINYHHADGGLRLASTEDHLDGYRHFISMAKGMGVDFELIDAEESKRRHPLITKDGLAGSLWDPMDGDIDPAQLCQALARRSRNAGAEIYRHTPVTGLTQKESGEWIVHTANGDITAEHVINAGGYRCNEVGAMMGVSHPVVSMEHQYFLTEPIPDIAALGRRVPLIRCPTDDFYSRQEKEGLLVGFYEQDCKTWGLAGIDPDFSNELCPNDLDRCIDTMEGAFQRLPCLTEAGIHTIVNGPITYTPDGLPLVGRIPGKRNAWAIIGLRAGLGEGGGHGWLLAQQMVHGEAIYDTWCLDPRRFGPHATTEYTALKSIEDYQNEFRFHMPHEHRPAGRPARTTPLTSVLEADGGSFAVVDGWERLAFVKPSNEYVEPHSFRFTDLKDIVAAEIDSVVNGAGITEVNGFNRVEVSGPGAASWLDGLFCGPIPKKTGKVALCYFLTERGNVLGEATIAKLADDRFWYGSAAVAERHDWDWLSARLPEDGVTLKNLTRDWNIILLAGPRSREVLSAAAPRTTWSANAFPWLSVQETFVGQAPAVAMSISFSGELAWEIHVPMEQSLAAWKSLRAAGIPHGMKLFGLYAIESMRIEKGYRHWKGDLIDEYNPMESALERFVRLERDFPGKAGLEAQLADEAKARFVTLAIDCDHAPAHPGDSVRNNDQVVGTVTSAAWGHRIGRNLAMAFVKPDAAEEGTLLTVDVVGEPMPAEIVPACLYDAANERVRQ
ncbi:MAG: FAD-dependent oxidoreductase [Alphaproteobacteria bacterium]|nr:FAD-dependent oxidoreductase [Alphaproteobacteria bacterium]